MWLGDCQKLPKIAIKFRISQYFEHYFAATVRWSEIEVINDINCKLKPKKAVVRNG